MKYLDELNAFKLTSIPVSVTRYGEGHINETYLVETDTLPRYILQKINTKLFTDVDGLMNNIDAVTAYIKADLKRAGETDSRKVLDIVKTKNDGLYHKSDNGCFRLYIFIEDATAYQNADEKLFRESAVAFGDFQRRLDGFNAEQLVETIPNFHNTVKRLADFRASLKRDASARAKDIAKEIDFVLSREAYASRVVSLLNSGEMPLRVTHNDTKLNNVMIDNKTGKALAVIDLDTVMPGSCCYDFGDSIRFGCNSGAEDEPDLSKIYFRPELFEAYTAGFLSQMTALTQVEKDHLAFSGILMTYECGMRFLSDHLDGDIYFRTHRQNQNLDRARTQFKLIEGMESMLSSLENTVKKYS